MVRGYFERSTCNEFHLQPLQREFHTAQLHSIFFACILYHQDTRSCRRGTNLTSYSVSHIGRAYSCFTSISHRDREYLICTGRRQRRRAALRFVTEVLSKNAYGSDYSMASCRLAVVICKSVPSLAAQRCCRRSLSLVHTPRVC